MRLLDTDVCIEILRGNERVLHRRLEIDDEVCTTWVTAAELAYGALNSAAPAHNLSLAVDFLETLPVLSPGLDAALAFGELKASLRRAGRTLADADLFVASMARTMDAVLVTGNRRHYERIEGLALEDWIR